jgi:very-short-patch-repair endonuclease
MNATTHHLAALAALIDEIGQPCVASGPTAAALHGFDGFTLRPPFHLTVPRIRNVRRLGHAIHTTTELRRIDRTVVEGIPSMSPTRTLLDLASTCSPAVLTAALDSALRDGGTSEDFLHRRIGALRSSGRYGIPQLVAVIEGAEITRGGQSWLEREFLVMLDRAGLPRPQTQAVLGRRGDRLIRVDFRFPGTPVVVEALGYRWHRTGAQMRIDVERLNQLTMDGFFVLQCTYADVVAGAAVVLASLRTALHRFDPATGLARWPLPPMA